MLKAKTSHRCIGEAYEKVAAQYLERQGLNLIETNFSCRSGEIDLIMSDRDTLVFVEVKYRKNQHYGHAAEFVTPAKARKLMKTASYWLHKQNLSPYQTHFRFDIIGIHHNQNDIEWLKNAVTQDERLC